MSRDFLQGPTTENSIFHLFHISPVRFVPLKLALGNLLPDDATELYKYQVLWDHLKFEEAHLITDSFLNSSWPYTDTMTTLTDRFGRAHQLALIKIAAVRYGPDVQPRDLASFDRFALQIPSRKSVWLCHISELKMNRAKFSLHSWAPDLKFPQMQTNCSKTWAMSSSYWCPTIKAARKTNSQLKSAEWSCGLIQPQFLHG